MSRTSVIIIILCCLLIVTNGCTCASSSEYLAESDHPYQNNYVDSWTIKEPGAAQIRIHFKTLELASFDLANYKGGNLYDKLYDKVIILDRYGNVVKTYGSYKGINSQDFWTNWYKGDELTVKLVTDGSRVEYGFVIDDLEVKFDEPCSSSETYGANILTVTELTSSVNPSAFGQSVTLTAEIDIPSQVTEMPSGTVTFMDGTMSIGTGYVTSRQATLTTSSLSSGSHSIIAEYSGDNNFEPSKSSAFILNVLEQTGSEEPLGPKITQPYSGEQSSTEQNSIFNYIIAAVTQNPLISTIVGGLIVGIILKFV